MRNSTTLLRTAALLVSVAFVVNQPINADDRRVDQSKLKIMTFNPEFLFDGLDPEGHGNFEWKFSPDEATEHMQEIAGIIRSANADIVNLVEVENIETLEQLNNDYLSGYGYNAYLIEGRDYTTRQDVAMLTRIDPTAGQLQRTNDKGVSGNTSYGVSKNYYATMPVGNLEIIFIGLHFRAFPLHSGLRLTREAQADAIRDLAIRETSGDQELVIWGDYNDFDPDCLDHDGNLPITSVLRILRELDPGTPDDDLVSVVCEAGYPHELRYTAWYDKNHNETVEPDKKELSSIDHILVSGGLAAFLESVEILQDHGPAEVSDHFPIVAVFDFSGSDGGTERTLPYISALVPNPVGDERQKEQATLTNPGQSDVDLTDWKLRDEAGKTWSLSGLGILVGGASATIQRDGQSMGMNNGGDTIELMDDQGQVVHSVSYSTSEDGEELEFVP